MFSFRDDGSARAQAARNTLRGPFSSAAAGSAWIIMATAAEQVSAQAGQRGWRPPPAPHCHRCPGAASTLLISTPLQPMQASWPTAGSLPKDRGPDGGVAGEWAAGLHWLYYWCRLPRVHAALVFFSFSNFRGAFFKCSLLFSTAQTPPFLFLLVLILNSKHSKKLVFKILKINL